MNNLKRPIQPMQEFVKKALEASSLMGKYRDRPSYQQNDYMWWINSAKQEATKIKRLNQMLDELRSGSTYMNMKWSTK